MTIDDIINAHNVVIPILGAIQPFTYAVKVVFVYPGKKQIEYAEKKGIIVQSLKYDYDVLKTITSTAEHAFLLMMACLRKLPFAELNS